MKKIKNYFFKGLLYFVPVGALIWVVIKSYVLLNGIIGKFLPENFQFLGIIIPDFSIFRKNLYIVKLNHLV